MYKKFHAMLFVVGVNRRGYCRYASSGYVPTFGEQAIISLEFPGFVLPPGVT